MCAGKKRILSPLAISNWENRLNREILIEKSKVNTMKDYKESFSIKLKILRNTYGLSLAELASMLTVVGTRASLYDWENKRSFPSMENLISLTNLFGVSLEWLLGRSETIYSDESIEWSEEAIGKYLHSLAALFPNSLQVSYWHFYLCEHYPEYAFEERRNLYYSLPVRANIAVLMREVRLTSLYWSMYYAENGFKR